MFDPSLVWKAYVYNQLNHVDRELELSKVAGETLPTDKQSRFFVHILVCSAEGPEKNYPLLRTLKPHLDPDTRILVMCAEEAQGPIDNFGPYVEFRIFPGASAIDLRGFVPSESGKCHWVVVLEDHIAVDNEWLQNLHRTLSQVSDDTTCVIGAAANLTSQEPWSWANFLNVQTYHWAPNLIEPVKPLGFNVAYRRDLLPNQACRPGEFEVACIPRLMQKPYASAEFPADHVQRRFLPMVLYYNYCNGRVSGAAIRNYHPDGLAHVFRHARYNLGGRRREVERLIHNHPHYKLLPVGTIWRVGILAFCHSVGAVVGGLFGPGRAAWALE